MKKIHLFIAFCFLFAINVLGQEGIPDYFCLTFNFEEGQTEPKTFYLGQSGSSWSTTPQLEYSFNGEDWNNFPGFGFSNKIDVSDGAKLYMRAGAKGVPGRNDTFSESSSNYIYFVIPSYKVDSVIISGNIMSLLKGEDFEALDTVPNYAFYKLFSSSSNLYRLSNLRLPATTLGQYCYSYMFNGCTSITAAPKLPAKILNKYCYSYMFNGCTKLNSIEVGFNTWPGAMLSSPDQYATFSWLSGVASLGTFICPKDLPKEFASGRIPTGWEVTHPAELSLEPSKATLCIGETFTLTPILDAQLEGKPITWSSDDDNIVTVSNEGIVTAQGLGTATITAAIEEMSLSATCEITVQNIPASVTDLSVTPDENGAIKANISFTIPSTNKLGENLTGTLTATILRNDAVIYTTDAKNLGDNVTYSDEFDAEDNPEAGFYTYSVFVTYNDVNSDNTSVSQFIGFDQPTPAENFTAVDNISGGKETIHFSWEAIEGVNKGYINPTKVEYNIYTINNKTMAESPINTSPIVGTTTSFDYDCTDDAQQEQDFVVVATIGGQTSQSEKASAILGKAYDLPFIEVFTIANPYFTKYWTDLSSDKLSKYSDSGFDNERAMKINGYKAYGSDVTPDDKQAILLSGKIQFTSADMPLLIFYSKTTGGKLTIECEDNDGVTHNLGTIQPSDSWTRYVLPFSDINADWIRLKITATLESVNGSGTQKHLSLDNIELRNIIRPESVILSQASGTLSMDDKDNQTLNLTATIAPADVDDATVTWSSSNTDVVEVDENGVVTAVGCGKAVIRATANLKGANNSDIYGVCNISVTGNTSIKDMDDNDIFVQLSENGTFNINDGEIKNISIAKTIKGVDVTYKRLFKNYAWLPWYMPFDVTLTGDLLQYFDFAQFAGAFYYTDNIKEGEMCITVQKMNLGDVVYANTPYMIRAKNPDSENAQTLEISSVTIVPTQEQVFEQLMRSATLDFNIKGIYNQYVSKADANSTLYYFTSKFTFSRITAADKSVNPFRFYMNIVPRTDNPYTQKVEETPAEIKIRTLDEDDADGIININFTDNDNVNWYDLSGRKVTNKSLPLAKGVYIYNGKKVLCK